MEIKHLPACQYPYSYGGVETCGKAAIAWVKFDNGSTIYLCEKHLEELEKGSEA